ncbi:PH domain-containing protein [Corynebacterium comes]|uniref:Bacterial membrane flanked domain protein n=1 Tax=Corynebacterium comes TaxID=2675218 RepID=A0A6B8VVY7_9CORY|nr:PH domain-containing protein [Corynebacterium comes]QGU03847.1 Bacterial membrane flanked domain protein [Corynebacterium comes]
MNEEYRRVHRLTPLLRFWTLILAAVAVFFVNIDMAAIGAALGWLSSGNILPILIGAAVFVVACGLVWVVSQMWWRATGYRLTAEEVSLRRGVLNTQLRTARYDRIQAVDVVESVIARIFRLAAVRVETAGGGDSVIEIAYLPRDVAEQLRREVLERARGTAPEAAPEALPVAVAAPAGRVIIPEIPITRSLTGAVLQGGSLGAVLVGVGLIVTPLTWAAAVPVALGIVPVIWNQIDRSWRFTARLAEDTLHLSYGLADRRRQSIPLHRIHGVTVHQPILWRIPGWWYVKVSVAGYGAETEKGSGTTQLLPVGSRQEALMLLELVSPLDAATIEASARPEGATTPTFTSPPVARWVSPIDLHQQAVTLLSDAVVVHRGRLARRVKVIDPSHIQELSLTRGPLQQVFGLCTVRFDLVPGPVRMAGEDLTPEDGRALLDALRQRELPAQRSDQRR